MRHHGRPHCPSSNRHMLCTMGSGNLMFGNITYTAVPLPNWLGLIWHPDHNRRHRLKLFWGVLTQIAYLKVTASHPFVNAVATLPHLISSNYLRYHILRRKLLKLKSHYASLWITRLLYLSGNDLRLIYCTMLCGNRTCGFTHVLLGNYCMNLQK